MRYLSEFISQVKKARRQIAQAIVSTGKKIDHTLTIDSQGITVQLRSPFNLSHNVSQILETKCILPWTTISESKNNILPISVQRAVETFDMMINNHVAQEAKKHDQEAKPDENPPLDAEFRVDKTRQDAGNESTVKNVEESL